MNQNRDRLEMIMEMFHQLGEAMISADSLLEAIECGVLEANGFACNRDEAPRVGPGHGRAWLCLRPQPDRLLVSSEDGTPRRTRQRRALTS
jgi:hypothetical protein